tara:strand:+ start:735 stop:1061 length:327 start_codon:yes stop_codon:yes gene_type:complete
MQRLWPFDHSEWLLELARCGVDACRAGDEVCCRIVLVLRNSNQQTSEGSLPNINVQESPNQTYRSNRVRNNRIRKIEQIRRRSHDVSRLGLRAHSINQVRSKKKDKKI